MIRRHKTHTLCYVLLLGLILAPGVLAQQQPPEFEVDAISVRSEASDGLTRLDLYTQVPYTHLSFLNTANGFTASYEVTVEVYEVDQRNRRQDLVETGIWNESVGVSDFSLTRSPQLFHYSSHSLDVVPGRYELAFQVVDQSTRELFKRELPIEVRSLNAPVAVSDIILLDDYNARTNTISPRVSNRVGADQPSFEIFYEIYADRSQQVRVICEVEERRKRSNTPPLVRSILRLGRGGDDKRTVVHTQTEDLSLRIGRHENVLQIPLDDFKVGEHIVRVRVEDVNGNLLNASERAIIAQWTGLDSHLADLEAAIEQLAYIAKPKDIRRIKEADTYNERLAQFDTFWKKRDPTPGTARNEHMEEYYYRISFANHTYGFGPMMAGWQTDRGQAFVKYGEPDYVEHPPQQQAKPVEIWHYYRSERKLIFVDESGRGNFRLMEPSWGKRF